MYEYYVGHCPLSEVCCQKPLENHKINGCNCPSTHFDIHNPESKSMVHQTTKADVICHQLPSSHCYRRQRPLVEFHIFPDLTEPRGLAIPKEASPQEQQVIEMGLLDCLLLGMFCIYMI
jgi:hypothetical protein